MSIDLNELKRRRAIIVTDAPDASRVVLNNILTASLGLTASEFDAAVFQAKVDVVVQKANSEFDARRALSEVEPVAKTSYDITTEILEAKYAKGVKQ